MKPVVLRNLLKPWTFSDLKQYVDQVAEAKENQPLDDIRFRRHTLHNDPVLVKLHKLLEPSLSTMLGRKVKPSYCLLSMYRNEGICYPHTDRPPCKYTIDLCVSQKHVWPIYIDGVPYVLEENEAVIYSGTHSPHYRHQIADGNHCSMIFFHFVDESYTGPLD